ncbi:MAG: YIP1 family protein [Anaerolineales bacterium]|nr:MAG: YIP1 family protein [Anaerolineales bacterium]
MIDRILRILRLDFAVFKEIESDPQATTEAAIIVVVTTLLSALGSAIFADNPLTSFVSSVVSGLVGWVVWSVVTYFVGMSIFGGKGTLEGMLRVIGYASAPNILGVFGVIPCLGWIAAFAGWLLALVAGMLAVSEGLDLSLGAAIGVVVIGWIAMVIVRIIIGIIFGGAFAVGAGLLGLIRGTY